MVSSDAYWYCDNCCDAHDKKSDVIYSISGKGPRVILVRLQTVQRVMTIKTVIVTTALASNAKAKPKKKLELVQQPRARPRVVVVVRRGARGEATRCRAWEEEEKGLESQEWYPLQGESTGAVKGQGGGQRHSKCKCC